MYFREPYTIDLPDVEGSLTITQPSIGDIVRIGENDFYNTLYMFISNTTTYRLALWEMGLDWNEISDFDLFTILYRQIDFEVSKLMFGDLDFSLFEPFQIIYENEESDIILKHSENGIEINEDVYLYMSQYLRSLFHIRLEEKLTDDPILKSWYIKKDKTDIENRSKKEEKKDSGLLPVISACVNHPGFKYKLDELKDVGVFQFFDSVSRLQVYESTTALLKGMYSGFVDTSKVPDESFNFMR